MPLKQSTNSHRETLWRQVESSISPNPWFLGERLLCPGPYLAAMTHWRPRQDWFRKECPKLFSIGAAAENLPPVASLFRASFD
jgi:GST-like protein